MESSTLSKATELAEKVPWITRLKKPQKCHGYRWGSMSRKATYDPVLKERYACKKPGYWKFKALKKSWARDGVYCWSHLLSGGVYGDMDEEARFERWAKKHEKTP